ncbi:DNA invertase Pin-like site-specific DNA recombinase [Herbihabitans rhizosphaerae]|uniref:DNA invertase Pin-like site-specific DNA recombinase n=1 Tax=Herbihabitans rhizosphaerae TaxID=1872711 RepID=A0A4Q7KUG5_9PSEU|nr:recombinase family protein [Herbihabitans rhizosphaerae]RZS39122.1 DNA invertase Pin-like site-specific DNA recombinase [Herbihabitans rhizosphaerae]
MTWENKSGGALRAVVAARLSKTRDGTTGDVTQGSDGYDYAVSRGWNVVGEPADMDVSAIQTSPWARPELGYWLRHPEQYEVLVFRDIQRMARRKFDFPNLMQWADLNGVRLICLSLGGDTVDFSTSAGRMIGMAMAEQAVIEGETITRNILRARKFMRTVGRWGAGRTPYPYTTCPHPSGDGGFALELDPEVQPIAWEVVQRVLAGNSDGQDDNSRMAIARDFIKRDIPTPMARRLSKAKAAKRGRPTRWTSATITWILSNPALIGWGTHYGKIIRHTEGDLAGEPVVFCERPLLSRPAEGGGWEPDLDTWYALQERLAETSAPDRRRQKNVSLLLGVVHCGRCGYRLYKSKAAQGPSYRCVSGQRGLSTCTGLGILAEYVEDWVEEKFLSKVGHLSTVVVERTPGRDNRVALAEVDEVLADLRADRAAGLFKGERGTQEYRAMYAGLEAKREALSAGAYEAPVDITRETGISYRHEWEVSDMHARRELLLSAGVRVDVAPAPHRGHRDWESRLTFSMTGAEALHEQGHDDPGAEENWS